MSTTFQQIYDLSSVTKTDTRLINKPSNQVEKYLFQCLIFSIGKFLGDCYQDISSSNRIDFQQTENIFQATKGTTTFQLDTPPVNFTDIYVNIGDTSTVYSYSFDDSTNILTISPALNVDCEVYTSTYIKGYFNTTLIEPEMIILAEGMNIPFLEQERNKNELLNLIIGNGKVPNQANQIDKLNSAISMQYEKIVRPMINEYSYKFSPSRCLGMAGRPNYTPTRTY